MYLHSKHVHPSVLAVMEDQGCKSIGRKTVSCKVIGESLTVEGYSTTGRKLVAEAVADDPILGGKPLFIPINEDHAFVLNAQGNYDVISEGPMDLIKKASSWLSGKWKALQGKLKQWFGKPGEVEQFEALYKKNPALAQKHFTDRLVASGKKPEEAGTLFQQFQKSYTEKEAKKAGITSGDQEMIHAMAGAADAKTPEEQQAAKQKLDRAHELAMAKQQKAPNVVQGGGGGKGGFDVGGGAKTTKPAAAQQPAAPAPAQQPPAPAGQQPAQQPAAATPPAAVQQPAQPAAPKDGDKVEKTDATGKKIEGQVITVDEAGAKKWNDQFAGKAGFIAIQAGPVVKTASGFVPLDKEWQVAAAPAAAAQPEVKPVPTADNAPPTNIPPTAAPAKPANAGLTDVEQGPGPAGFDPNATVGQPAGKPGIPAGAQQVGADTLAAGITNKHPNLAKGAPASAAARSAAAAKKKALDQEQRLLNKGQGNIQASSVQDHRKPVNEAKKGNLLEVFEPQPQRRRRLGKGTK